MKSQLEVTGINFRPIHEDGQSFPNAADMKSKFWMGNMGVNYILNFMGNPNTNFILLSEVIRIKPILKLNEILNQALLNDKKEEIGIHNRTLPTLLLYLFFWLIFEIMPYHNLSIGMDCAENR